MEEFYKGFAQRARDRASRSFHPKAAVGPGQSLRCQEQARRLCQRAAAAARAHYSAVDGFLRLRRGMTSGTAAGLVVVITALTLL
jgi:hypothetical protein